MKQGILLPWRKINADLLIMKILYLPLFLPKLTIDIWKFTWYLIAPTNIVPKITLSALTCLAQIPTLQNPINNESRYNRKAPNQYSWYGWIKVPPIYLMGKQIKRGVQTLMRKANHNDISILTYNSWHKTFDVPP